jgi:OOP family OmpA-OmpF porin
MNRHFSRFVLAASFFALSLASAPALSQDMGWYFGLGAGQSKAKDSCDGVSGPGVSCDDTDTAFKIFGGYQVNANFGVELGYVDLGEVSASHPVFGSGKIEAKGIELVGVLAFPINQQFSVFGKLGVFRWDVDASGFGSPSESETGTDVTFGFGAKYNFTKNFGLRLEWQRYNDVGDENTTGKDDVDYFGASIIYKF